MLREKVKIHASLTTGRVPKAWLTQRGDSRADDKKTPRILNRQLNVRSEAEGKDSKLDGGSLTGCSRRFEVLVTHNIHR